MNVLNVLFRVFALTVGVCTLTYRSVAQSIPEIPFDIDFAGVTVHLNEQGRERLQREVVQLYANRTVLQRDIESLRQLTPLLEPLLNDERLPADYRYAALPSAGDEVTGYWGLSPARARVLRMVVDDAVDERYHPTLATETVAAHLGRLHTVSDNYVLTLLRYIQGDTLTDRLADKVNSTYMVLDAQSPSLMWQVMARKLAFEREEPLIRSTQTYLLYEFRNAAGLSLRTISRQLRLDEDRFKPFNSWLTGGSVPKGKEYPVLIRVTADEFPAVKSRDDVRRESSAGRQSDMGFPVLTKLPPSTVSTHKSAAFYTINSRRGVQAQPCDNVITLAHYGNISIEKLLSYNELTEQDVVQPGQIYYLERKAKRAKIPFHVVQKNQTLREIANVYGVQLKSLLRFNRILATQRVQTGRVVWMQTKRPQRQPVQYRQQAVRDAEPVIDDTPSDSLPAQTIAKPVQIDSSTAAAAPSISTDEDRAKEEVIGDNQLTPDSTEELTEALKLHVVSPGQTYYGISKLYGVTLRQLYAWNNLSERIPLKVGQELIVDLTKKAKPVRQKTGSSTLSKSKIPLRQRVLPPVVRSAEPVVYHVVKPGQTVYRVALINKVSVPDLMRWNNLKDYTIEVGQRLIVKKGK